MKIYPSVMAKNQKELNLLFKKLSGVAKELHFDVVDNEFIKKKSDWFAFRLSSKFKYNVHLMVENPLSWIKKHGKKFALIIFHPEPVKDVKKVISVIKKLKKKVGLSLKPETSVSSIKKYLPELDYVLILTVHPGRYGAKFLKEPLKKINQIKKINPKVKTIVDGGMSPETIKLAKEADAVVSGSFVSKAENPKKAMRELKEAC